MRNKGTVHLRLELETDMATQFETIKNHLGLKLNTEVVRALIRDAYKEILSQSPLATPGSLVEAHDPLRSSVEAPVSQEGGLA